MSRTLRILHCLRAPVGGLFRHVVDLALEQSLLGHEVGVLYDHRQESEAVAPEMALLHQHCRLGVRTTAMSRLLSYRDYTACRALLKFSQESGAQILHGHGAKGGAYARLACAQLNKRLKGHPRDEKGRDKRVYAFYTPHGGSLHYDPSRLSGRLFLGLEKKLAPLTSGLIFESRYSASLYEQVVGPGFCPQRIIPNGLKTCEFEPVVASDDAADFVFIGELRHLKGVDVLLHALHGLQTANQQGREGTLRLAIVGDGPDMGAFQKLASTLKLDDCVTFHGRLPARRAFSLGRAIVVPSRAESFPYIVLEAGAAQLPLIATDVGGISEIVAGSEVELIGADDPRALQEKMAAFLNDPALYQRRAQGLADLIRQKFTIETMSSRVTDFYLSVLRP